jgi:hypothetical protein
VTANRRVKTAKTFGSRRFGRSLVWATALGVLAALAPLGPVHSDTTPTLTTDKADYAPEEVVHVSGTGFVPGTYAMPVKRPDGSIVVVDPSTHQASPSPQWENATADDNGNLAYNYQLDGIGGTYEVRAYPSNWSGDWGADPIARVTFTDAPNPSADLDQCANGKLGADPAETCDTTFPENWINGDLVASKSHYGEGESVPYRIRMDNLSTGAPVHTVTIEYDALKGGKHAIDYLTTWNRTVTDADPCAEIHPPPTTIPGCVYDSSDPGDDATDLDYDTQSIPTDPYVTAGPDGLTDPPDDVDNITQIPGVFTLYGPDGGSGVGRITGVTGPTVVSGADRPTRYTISFQTTVPDPVLAWGGHIATRQDWGITNSAVSISGSPYHMRLRDLDGSGGNQDHALSAEAVIFPATITIHKDAVPNDPQNFDYTTTNLVPPLEGTGGFTLDDASPDDADAFSNTEVIDDIKTFDTKTVTEGAVTGWATSFPDPACTVTAVDSTHPSTFSTSGSELSIVLKEGDGVDCTFTNTRQTAHLFVIKHVINDNGGNAVASDFAMSTGGTNASPADGFAGAESPGTDVTLDPGSYSVSETGPSGYTASFSANCLSGTIAAGETKTCTVTNDDVAPGLTVIKHVVNDDGGNAVAGDFTMSVNNATSASPTSFAGVEDPGTAVSIDANDSYDVTESGPTGYTSSFSSGCTDTDGLDEGQTKTCTVTNDDIPPNTGKIAPTATTCQNYRDQTAADLNELFYGVKGNPPKVNSVSPGVLFYYTTVTAPSASFDITIAQTDNSATFPAFDVHHGQAVLYNGTTCAKLGLGTDGGSPTIHVSGATVGQVFIVGVKYDPTTVKGTNATGFPTVRYTFTTQVNGVPNGSSDFIDLKPKFP